MDRRKFLTLMSFSLSWLSISGKAIAAHGIIKILELSNKEWRLRLSDKQYNILREEGTERPYSSELNDEKRDGLFICAGCGLDLFDSKTKYDSKTGWPSFYDVIKGHIKTKKDYKFIFPRTEYSCAKCGGHQGHIFKDSPKPTGLRYCNNGLALKFVERKNF